MEIRTVERIVLTAALIGLVVDVAAPAIVVSAWAGLSGPFVTVTATALMVATLALQMTYIFVQPFPNGGAIVPVRWLGPDAWEFVIVSTALPGVLWHKLAELAIPPMRLLMPGFTTPLFMALVLLVARVIQRRRMTAIRE